MAEKHHHFFVASINDVTNSITFCFNGFLAMINFSFLLSIVAALSSMSLRAVQSNSIILFFCSYIEKNHLRSAFSDDDLSMKLLMDVEWGNVFHMK